MSSAAQVPRSPARRLHVGIVGAGAIGSYVGLSLAAGGCKVTALARKADPKARRMRRLDGRVFEAPEGFAVVGDVQALTNCDVVCVAVKSRNTAEVGASLQPVLDAKLPVLSLQNGLGNAGALRGAGLHAIHGVVTFNVRAPHAGDPAYAQTTSGPIMIGDDAALTPRFDEACRAGGLDLRREADIEGVARGKLVLNLNNGVCAAAGVSIVESVRSRPLRRLYAACIEEALAVFAARNESVLRMGKLAPRLIARVLPLPNAIVRVLARPMVKIDPAARSSTLVDLEAGRPTEIDELNGAIVALGAARQVPTPANEVVRETVRTLERSAKAAGPGAKLPHPAPGELWAEVVARTQS